MNETTSPGSAGFSLRRDAAQPGACAPGRRSFLAACARFGLAAGALPLIPSLLAAGDRTALPHHAPRAKRIILLTMSGGPSQLELFDHKPGLMRHAGSELPGSPPPRPAGPPQTPHHNAQ